MSGVSVIVSGAYRSFKAGLENADLMVKSLDGEVVP